MTDAEGRNGKVLVVGMDGLRYDRLTREPSNAPVLHGLMAAGAVGTSLLPYGEADGHAENGPSTSMAYTDSGPGWSSILTGVWPDRHGVRGNDFVGADYARYPDFLTRAATAGRRTAAAVSWPQLVRRGVLGPAIERRRRYNGEFRGYRTADRRVARTALRWLTRHDPDVVFVYFGATDEAGHDTGPLSPAYDRALLAQDAHLGRLLEAIDARRSDDPRRADERWTVLVTTDHGHLDSGGHGGDTHAEREVFVILAEPGRPGGSRPEDTRLDDIPSHGARSHPTEPGSTATGGSTSDGTRPHDTPPDNTPPHSPRPHHTRPSSPPTGTSTSHDAPPHGAPSDNTPPHGLRLDSPRLIDIAPTVLDRLGIPVDPAWGLQGRVLPRPIAPTSDRS
ncbi:alkaline phosphatase family protein [Streptomyces sp. NPDC002092]